MALSVQQYMSMPQSAQVAYMKSLTPAQQQQLQAQVQQAAAQMAIAKSNLDFMRGSIKQFSYCPVSGGSGTTAAYQAGVTLSFDLPVVGSAYAVGLLITYDLSVTPATGTGAAYALNAAAPWNIFSQLQLNYNGTQVRTHPYILKLLDMTYGRLYGAQNAVLAGQADSTVTSNINGASGLTVGSANTWLGKMYLPLNALGEDSVPGILPAMGQGNKPQIQLTCAPSFLGVDPLLNPVAPAGGTGNAITVTGTINVDMVFLNGLSMYNTTPLPLTLAGLPTLQYIWDTPLNPLNSGLVQRQHIASLLEHCYVFSVVIDGNQSNKFAAITNLQAFELSPDQTGFQTFKNYNVANNISVYDYYNSIRRQFGQDLDEGVVVWVSSPTAGLTNPSNRNGKQTLNMQPGGYPATTHGYQVGSVGAVPGITPRVETFLISLNPAGLNIQ